jgi:CheY-like chemotaxis protein
VEINREIVMGMLEDTGLQIICVENGLEALESFTSSPEKYDAILMDINMPEMDGLEATRRIRALETPEGRLTPIIALTANVLHSEVETYIAGGMTDHLSKPLDNDQLLQKLYKHMNTA